MKKLPIGIQTFEKMIDGEFLYVDKTRGIFEMITSGQYFFLSRPRRFGKSLLVSTLKEIFSGNKELFKGLWIYDKIDWEKYPVIHIDFSKISYKTTDLLEKSLEKTVRKIGKKYNIHLDENCDYKNAFSDLIEEVAKIGKVVILIDEYDKPIIDKISQPEIAMGNRDVLREFYAVIKASDEFNRFAFITGISKFSKVSVFSGLNNLIDITINETYSTLLGYTQEELLRDFGDRLERIALEEGKPQEELVDEMRTWYDGYSWDGKRFVYNPFSVLNFFYKEQLGNYWFDSGTPSMLITLIKESDIDVKQLESYKAGETVFNSFDIDRLHIFSLLFQTGYLTIKEVEPVETGKSLYVLSYPNLEVKESFMELL